MNWFRFAALGALAVVPLGCGGLDGVEPADSADPGTSSATATFELNGGPSLYGHSVKLCGKRVDEHGASKPAGATYDCISELPCDCYAFDPSGGLTVWNSIDAEHVPARIEDLCPSDNVPVAEWEFTFSLYTDGTCGYDGGHLLNGGGSDSAWVCWDAEHFQDPYMENRIREPLDTGRNENHVICVREAVD